MVRLFLLSLLVCALSACPPPPEEPCARTCNGCCSTDGECLPGSSNDSCGANGAECADCTGVGVCTVIGYCYGGKPDAGPDGGTSEDCGSPGIVTVTGSSTFTGDTSLYRDDLSGSCGGAGGKDQVFRLNTSTAGNLLVEVRPAGPGFRPLLHLRAVCDDSTTELVPGCLGTSADGGTVALTVRGLPAGAYFLVVDSQPGTEGAYLASVRLSSTLGESCTAPFPLSFNQGELLALGRTTGTTDNATGTCGGGSTPDVVYSFSTPASATLDAVVSPLSGSTSYQPVVYLRSPSCTGSDRACAAAASPGANANLSASVGPGTHYLWVDGQNQTAGDFRLVAHLTPPPAGDNCSAPRPLLFSDAGTSTEFADTLLFGNDAQGNSCASGSSPDVVYSFTTSSIYSFQANASAGSPFFRPALYLRSSCGVASDLACSQAAADGGTASLSYENLAPGTYFLWVDGVGQSAGAFTLTSSLLPPTLGERCTGPQPLAFDGGVAWTTGDTSNLVQDTSGGCASGSNTSPDMVYSFSVSSLSDFSASLSTTSAGYWPAVYLRGPSCTGSDLVCNVAAAAGGSVTLRRGSLTPGTYFLFIDGASTSSGPFVLSATLSPTAAGESCANPVQAAVNALGEVFSYTEATSPLSSDSSFTCSVGTAGPDLVHQFTTTTVMDLTATANAAASPFFRPLLSLASGPVCSSATQTDCVTAPTDGGIASLSASNLLSGTYFLWLAGSNGTSGSADLNVNFSPSTPGDVCPTAVPLNLVGGSATVQGSTASLHDDATPNCGGLNAPDTVYSLSVGVSGQTLSASVTPTVGTYRPALHLRLLDCANSTAEVACNVAAALGGVASVSVPQLAAGTYYLWVDGGGQTSGSFTLNVTLN